MLIQIDNSSKYAAYEQIIDQIKRDIALGRLTANEKLPTVRQLAGQLAINPNTIAKSYRLLEREGIIITRPGAGAYVADLDCQLSRSVREKLITDALERIVVESFHMQIDKETLTQWFYRAVEKFNLFSQKDDSADE